MFERFTERARRVIFFARYEASQLGSTYINPEHLLLALFREDTSLRLNLTADTREAIRSEIARDAPQRVRVSTSVDIPMSEALKRALAYADEESKALQNDHLDCAHLVLGLLRVEQCAAAILLRKYGVNLESYRGWIARTAKRTQPGPQFRVRAVDRPRSWGQTEPGHGAPLQRSIDRLAEVLDRTADEIAARSDEYADQRLKRKPWSRKEALGNLVDWGITYQHWIAQALSEPNLIAPRYPEDEWVSKQDYDNFSWPDLVDLWVCINRLLIHTLAQVPKNKLNLQCRVGIEQPISLSELVERYIDRCDDIAGQILAHL